MARQASFYDYEGFVEKFEPKKTTDDCYTPPEVMEAVESYVEERWGLDRASFVRPFWPGGDYEDFDYPEGCVVVDNPPFSILAGIQAFYLERGIRFFLFAPALTCLSGERCMEVDHIVCDADIVYENGAAVKTGFVTNLDGEHVLESDPHLGGLVNGACRRIRAAKAAHPPKYEYPDAVITAARAGYLAAHGTPFRVRREDCCRISAMDAQRAAGKSIFGGGLLLSERAAAERAAAKVWKLSDREREIVAMLGRAES